MANFKLADGTIVSKAELDRLRSEDFEFLALCESKRNRGMYQLLRNTALDTVKVVTDTEEPLSPSVGQS